MGVNLPSGSVLGPIQRLFARGTVAGLSEGQLLARFVRERDEIAFEAIVSRHGPMVLGICRRLLDDPHDVEDAFQATFLVLVRRAGSLRDCELLANWLYGVALKVASRARRDRARRSIRERPEFVDEPKCPPEEFDLGELRSVLDCEVARLPERFRTPIILCYFEGMTHDQAAERLRCPVGTVRSRMAKARELLRTRLARRGFGPEPAVPAGPLIGVSPAVPPALLIRTSATVSSVIVRSLLAGGPPTSAIALARGVLRAMTFSKWMMTFASALLVLGAVGGGVRVAARQDGAPSAKSQGRVPPSDDDGRPVRKALEEVQSWIDRYEEQLAAGRDEIAAQKRQIKELTDRIRALEARANSEDSRPPDPTPSMPLKAAVSIESPKAQPGEKVPVVDRILASEKALASISGSNDRVTIYDTQSHRSRTYRLPHDMKSVFVTFHGDDVAIVANGPHGAHLADYNLKTDRWALQDLRGGTEGLASIDGGGRNTKEFTQQFLLPCTLQGSGFTQVAVFDVGRGTWSIQNLVEPSEQWVTPILRGRLAMYVLRRHVYAYSAETGTWDTLTLEENLIPTHALGGAPILSDRLDMFAVSQHGRLHLFTEKTGRWETVNPKD
jgi:RNA polymerase sigma factor (sigma-70 family)